MVMVERQKMWSSDEFFFWQLITSRVLIIACNKMVDETILFVDKHQFLKNILIS